MKKMLLLLFLLLSIGSVVALRYSLPSWAVTPPPSYCVITRGWYVNITGLSWTDPFTKRSVCYVPRQWTIQNLSNSTYQESIMLNTTMVSIQKPTSHGNLYHFICTTRGYTPLNYSWDFDDGTLLSTTNGEVYHAFPYLNVSTHYVVSCTSASVNVTSTGSLNVTVKP